MDRYHRQTLLPQISTAGQARLSAVRVLMVGCGALGTVAADQLARAGVGLLRVVDRDIVEETNLQRQVLFDEEDASAGVPKAAAAARRLREINSRITVEPIVADLHCGNVEEFVGVVPGGTRVDLIVDGTDNAETRYLLNDVSIKHGIPWIYGACVGVEGRVMAVLPEASACLRCLFAEPPGPGELPTCDTAGVLGAASAVVGALQAAAAIRVLTGQLAAEEAMLVTLDVWTGRFRATPSRGGKRDDCIACGQRKFEFLDSPVEGRSVSLCGRDAIQVRPAAGARVDLNILAHRLSAIGTVERTPYLLRCDLSEVAGVKLTVFPDGRAILHGVSNAEQGQTLYARWIGN